jgi:GxxExxY protein
MTENELARMVFDLGLKVHKTLGPGLLESVYEECLVRELIENNIEVERQKEIPIIYNDKLLSTGFRVDIMIEKKLIIELKATKEISDLHMAQLLTYLKLSNCKLGLVINFNSVLFKNGVRRIINGYL